MSIDVAWACLVLVLILTGKWSLMQAHRSQLGFDGAIWDGHHIGIELPWDLGLRPISVKYVPG